MFPFLLAIYINQVFSNKIFLENEEIYVPNSMNEYTQFPGNFSVGGRYQNFIQLLNISIEDSKRVIQSKTYQFENFVISYFLIQKQNNIGNTTNQFEQEIRSYQLNLQPFQYYQEGSNFSFDKNLTCEQLLVKKYDIYSCWDMSLKYKDIYVLCFQNTTNELYIDVINSDKQSELYKFREKLEIQSDQNLKYNLTQKDLLDDSMIFTLETQICILIGHKQSKYSLYVVSFLNSSFELNIVFSQEQFQEITLNKYLYHENSLYLYGNQYYLIIDSKLQVKLQYNLNFTAFYPGQGSFIEPYFMREIENKYYLGVHLLKNTNQRFKTNFQNLSILFCYQFRNRDFEDILYNNEYLYLSGREINIHIDFIDFIKPFYLLFITSGNYFQIFQIIAQTINFIQVQDKKVIYEENLIFYNLNKLESNIQFNLTLPIQFNQTNKETILRINYVPLINLHFLYNQNSIIRDILQRNQIIELNSIQSQLELNIQNSKLIYFDETQEIKKYVWVACYQQNLKQNLNHTGYYIITSGFRKPINIRNIIIVNCQNINEIKLFYTFSQSDIFLTLQQSDYITFSHIRNGVLIESFTNTIPQNYQIIDYNFKSDCLFTSDYQNSYLTNSALQNMNSRYQLIVQEKNSIIIDQFHILQIQQSDNKKVIQINYVKLQKLDYHKLSQILISFFDIISYQKLLIFNENHLAVIVLSGSNLIIYHYIINEIYQFIFIKQVEIKTYLIQTIIDIKNINNIIIITVSIQNIELQNLFIFDFNYASNYCLRIISEKLSQHYLITPEGDLVFVFPSSLQVIYNSQILIKYDSSNQQLTNSFKSITQLTLAHNKLINLGIINIQIIIWNDNVTILNDMIKIQQQLHQQFYYLDLSQNYIGLLSNIVSTDFVIYQPFQYINEIEIGYMQSILFLNDSKILQIGRLRQIISIQEYLQDEKGYQLNLLAKQSFNFQDIQFYKKINIQSIDYFVAIYLVPNNQNFKKIQIYKLNYDQDDVLSHELTIEQNQFQQINLDCYTNKNQLILVYQTVYIIYNFEIMNNKLIYQQSTFQIDSMQQQIIQYEDECFLINIENQQLEIYQFHGLQLSLIYQTQILPLKYKQDLHLLYKDERTLIFLVNNSKFISLFQFNQNEFVNQIRVKLIEQVSPIDFYIINKNILIIKVYQEKSLKNVLLIYQLSQTISDVDQIIYPLQILEFQNISRKRFTFHKIYNNSYVVWSEGQQLLSFVQIRSTYMIELKNETQQKGIIILETFEKNTNSKEILILIENKTFIDKKIKYYTCIIIVSLCIQAIFLKNYNVKRVGLIEKYNN